MNMTAKFSKYNLVFKKEDCKSQIFLEIYCNISNAIETCSYCTLAEDPEPG